MSKIWNSKSRWKLVELNPKAKSIHIFTGSVARLITALLKGIREQLGLQTDS